MKTNKGDKLMENWGNKQDALKFYGVSLNTLYRWRKQGVIPSKESAYKNRFEYLYLLEDSIKEKIEFMKHVDKRWG